MNKITELKSFALKDNQVARVCGGGDGDNGGSSGNSWGSILEMVRKMNLGLTTRP